ncbi:cystathionine gamma-lyase-like [Acanthaster planci]|uniref:cystathionine gamma-lyase n=1 Tax=Acanthaster planci TaxID=133434 RepID=A0A8B7Y633_ACAPL|nr:cystathionine gamma-lyase-like [Acanthaster planci]
MNGPNAEYSAQKRKTTFPGFATAAIHAGQDPEQWASHAVTPLICMSTTFKQSAPGELKAGYEYSRGGNPTRKALEECIAALDGAQYGLAFGSGLAATTAICQMLKSGDTLVCMDDLYGGTNRFFNRILVNSGVKIKMVDASKVALVEAAIDSNTKLIWIETPTNPTLRLVDIEEICKVAHLHDIIVVVDNTFASSYFQRPLDFGADIVLHSATKYANGHSDVVMGLVTTKREDIKSKLYFLQYASGGVPSPFDCFLVNRGLKTLHVRMREHEKNALAVARALEANPRVAKVTYPGLKSHPQHELAKKQMRGFGGMVTFRIKGGLVQARDFFKYIKVFTLAESLGGFESLAELPAIMTHASVPPDQRVALGIDDTLIRLSVGIEDEEDLVKDVTQALEKAVPESML